VPVLPVLWLVLRILVNVSRMTDPVALSRLAVEALLLALVLSIPVLAASMFVGVLASIFQSATQISEPVMAHLPRLLLVAVVLALTGPWVGSELVAFATRVFSGR